METIIGLLFILLPVIFKLIGKKLEQAGQSETAEKIKEIAQYMGADEDVQEVAIPKEEQAEKIIPVSRPVAQVVVTENVERQVKSAPKKTKKPILLEEPEKEREKIDPKKLVVYSEIMKPKYTE